ncbi:SDR family NAD(P)-dependent oxidoreductase [Micromonospora eburnea]|uniref:NAD(P)-dependent dehydrogenase, short-chain alcohol dehydrogenase family n=1 Tax=Micromonospora eburnea TaxID=227316 RepID=A0A1C6UVK0_9ACTN|nr:SDR family oxidoreductase [Micromonospora eburnea]SCL58028.1 NAD(P)-dependent dehydrogenase, short-chain alcohol dehydrogenase family [Micromonospora eburnea]
MSFEGLRVAVTGAGRDTGRLLALAFAERGAHVYVSARNPGAAERTAEWIRRHGPGTAEPLVCDLARPDSVRAFAATLADRTDHLDVLVNNGAGYVHGDDLGDVEDEAIIATIGGAATGTVLLTKHLLPLLRASVRPDIVNLISTCGEVGHRRSNAHPAFYAAKHAQAGFAEIISHRLRAEGIRVISLFPPDFVQDGPREATGELTARSVVECVLFAVGQPPDCFIREFRFEQVRSPRS